MPHPRAQALVAGLAALVLAAGVAEVVHLEAQSSGPVAVLGPLSPAAVVPAPTAVRSASAEVTVRMSPAPSSSAGPSPTHTLTAGEAREVPGAHDALPLPTEEPSCITGEPMPRPLSEHAVDLGGDDPREILVQGEQTWVSRLPGESQEMSLSRVDTASGKTASSRTTAGFQLGAVVNSAGWGVRYGTGDVVVNDLREDQVLLARELSVGAPGATRPEALALATAGGLVYVIGTQDSRRWDDVWLTAVDASTRRVVWSVLLPGSTTSGWSYVPQAGIAADGDEVVVSVAVQAGVGVWRYSSRGALLARTTFWGDVRDTPRVAIAHEAVFLSVFTPLSADDESWTTTLVRLERSDLSLTATRFAHSWLIWPSSAGLLVEQVTCDGGVLALYDGRTLAPLRGLELGRREGELLQQPLGGYDLDVVDDVLWLLAEDVSEPAALKLSSWSLA